VSGYEGLLRQVPETGMDRSGKVRFGAVEGAISTTYVIEIRSYFSIRVFQYQRLYQQQGSARDFAAKVLSGSCKIACWGQLTYDPAVSTGAPISVRSRLTRA
jgi:hypothetical protein